MSFISNLFEKIKKKIFNYNDIDTDNIDRDYEKRDYFIKQILSNHKFGDIIWAYRYDYDWDRDKTGNGHDKGPFIVIGKTEDKLICCYCTSVSNKSNYFAVGEDYCLFKNGKVTYTSVSKIKTIDYISYLGNKVIDDFSLNYSDRIKLIKHLKLNGNVTYSDLGIIKDFNIPYSVRLGVKDVVKYNGNYYLIIDNICNKFLYIKLDSYNPASSIIDFSNFKLNNICSLDGDDFEYVNTISNKSFTIILKLYRDYLDRSREIELIKDRKIIDRGCIIKYNNKYYYVNGISGNDLLCFEVVYTDNNLDNYICVEGHNFTAFYDKTISINKNLDNFDIVFVASYDEMNFIKEEKKHYLKNRKKEIKKNKNNVNNNKCIVYHLFSDIVESSIFFNMEFLVIGINGKNIITLSLDDLYEGKYVYRVFRRDEVSIKNKSHILNKWFYGNIDKIQDSFKVSIEIENIIRDIIYNRYNVDIYDNRYNYYIDYSNLDGKSILDNDSYYKLISNNNSFVLAYSVKDFSAGKIIYRGRININDVFNDIYSSNKSYVLTRKI